MRRSLAIFVLPPLLLSLQVPLPGPASAAEDPTPVAGQRWTEFAPFVGPDRGRAQAAALAPDGSVLLVGSTSADVFGIAKVDVPTGTPRADFGRDGYADLTDVLPTGTPLDVAARADGGAYLLLEKSLRLRYEDPLTRPLTVGVTAITGDGRPDPAFGSVPNFGQVGTRYLAPREGSEITGVGGIAMGAGDEPVIAYTEKHPGEVTEVNPAPSPQTDVVLRRLNADGTVDAAYGDSGLGRWVNPVQLQPGMAGSVEVERVRAAGGGAVLVLVKSLLYSPQTSERHQRLHVLRFTAGGDLDPGFGDGGAVEVAAARPDCGPDTNPGIRTPLAVGPGGSFVVVSSLVDGNGYCSEPSGYDDPSDLLVNVFEPDGTPDDTFSSDGRLVHHVVQREVPGDALSRDLMKVNQPEAVLMDRLGRVVVATYGGSGSLYGGLVRFGADGALDEGFGASAGDFSAPPMYAGNDLIETSTDDYLMPGAPAEPFAFRGAQASLYLADGDLPTTSTTPVPDPEDAPRIIERQDRALRPGDELELRLGTWTGPAVDHFEIAWLGCESRHQTNSRCVDQPLGRSVVDGQATSATFELPEHAAGQYLSATVVAVAPDGARGRTTAYGGTMGPSRHLIEEVADTGLLDLTNGRFDEGEVYALADGTIGSVYAAHGQVFDGRLRILERAPSGERAVVVARDDIQNVVVNEVVTTADGWVHVVLTSFKDGNVYAVDRDPATGTWSQVVQLSNVGNADGEARLRVGYGGVSAAPGGRVAVAWAELQPRGDDAPPPVAVRVRTPDGWQPVHYAPEPLEVSCGDGTKTCYPDPPGDGRTFEVKGTPLVAVTESGAVQVAWRRTVGVHAYSFSDLAYTARQSPAGDWTGPTRLVPVAHADLTPVRLAALADGSILFLARESFDNAQRERLVLQVVPAGATVAPDQGDGFPGQVLRTYGLVDEVYTSIGGDHTFPIVVDGTHWRLALSEDVARAGNPQTRRLLMLEGLGSDLQPVQTLDRRDPNPGAYDVTFAAAPGGKALLVTDSQSQSSIDLEYAVADGNGPMTRLQPVRTELPGGSVHLEPAPETGRAGEARNLGLREVRGSWQLTTLSRQGALRAHRLALGAAGPRLAVAYGETLPRPGKPYTVAVDPERTFDPDGGQLDLAWDLDGDGAYDDATGPQASVVPGPAGEEQLVAVRATSADGDRADAVGSVYPVENQAPDLYQLDGPTTAVAGEEVLFEAWAYDDESEDLLTYTWYVEDVAQPAQTGPSARLALPAGSVDVRVVVTDSDGATDEASRTVQVTGVPAVDQPPTVAISGPAGAVDGDVTRFFAVAADDGGAAALSYVWKVDGRVVPGVTGARADLVLTNGARSVSVGVQDAGGLTATASKAVRVTVSGTRLPDQPVRFVSLSGKLLKVTATVPKKGTLAVVLKKAGTRTALAAATVKVTGKGVKSVTLKLTAAGVRALRAKGSHAVDAVSTLTPSRGAKQSRTHRVTVVRR